MTVELKDVDMRIINRGVICIILNVIAVFLSMFDYALDYIRNITNFSDIYILLVDLIIDFLLLSLVY